MVLDRHSARGRIGLPPRSRCGPILKVWTRETSLADHKFRVGQTVDYSPPRRDMPAMSRLYKIVRLLPPEDGQLLYRIKGSSEPFERIAREQDLSRP
jgi:hypothetical protein